jgi:hypothetical protein
VIEDEIARANPRFNWCILYNDIFRKCKSNSECVDSHIYILILKFLPLTSFTI